jgi:serine protease Do
MNYLAKSFRAVALSTGIAAASVAPSIAQTADNDNQLSFSCNMPQSDYSTLPSHRILPSIVQDVMSANVFIEVGPLTQMPFGLMPNMPTQMPLPRQNSLGSGFIIDADQGYIVTNAHVLEDMNGRTDNSAFSITFYDPNAYDNKGVTVSARLIGIDSSNTIDLAVLQIEVDRPLSCVHFGDSATLLPGETSFAIGNPLGQTFTVSSGIISNARRTLRGNSLHEFIQTDAAINRGNSGGALYNLDGQVIGVNTAILSQTGGSIGIGMAIPSNVVVPTVNQLIQYGEISRGFLAVGIQDLSDQEKAALPSGYDSGVRLPSVTADGPADRAGLMVNDIILEINGQRITSTRQLSQLISQNRPGAIVDILVSRDGILHQIPVELGNRAQLAPAAIEPRSDNPGIIIPEDDSPQDEVPDFDGDPQVQPDTDIVPPVP